MSAPKYASGTDVPVSRTRDELERTLARYGATAFMYGTDHQRAVVQFQVDTDAGPRQVRLMLPFPDRTDRDLTHTPTGQPRSPAQAEKVWEQAVRARWRALLLIVKAKLEAVASGVAEFDDEFLAYIALPSGGTVGDWMRPQIVDTYERGTMPAMLPGQYPPALGEGS